MISTLAPAGPAPISPTPQSAQKTALPQIGTARSSIGENAAANVRAETTRAIDAPQQSPVAQRLREQEIKEQSQTVFDELVGPKPTFEESPLERQARTAFDPPEAEPLPEAPEIITPGSEKVPDEAAEDQPEVPIFRDPPPTPRERAEVSFAETRTLAEKAERLNLDVAR